MILFVAGLVVGMFWRDLKWLTYDLLKAICRGIYTACRAIFFGKLKPGATRWQAIKCLPKEVSHQVRYFLKWEWLNGCKVTIDY